MRLVAVVISHKGYGYNYTNYDAPCSALILYDASQKHGFMIDTSIISQSCAPVSEAGEASFFIVYEENIMIQMCSHLLVLGTLPSESAVFFLRS